MFDSQPANSIDDAVLAALVAQWSAEDDVVGRWDVQGPGWPPVDDASLVPPVHEEGDWLVAAVLVAGPGPWAASVLDGIDPDRLSESGRLDLLKAWQAQVAWAEARGAHCLDRHVGPEPDDDSSGHVVPVGAIGWRGRVAEVALTLRLSEATVRSRHQVARDLATRLPQTARALADGRITWVHARAVSEATGVLGDADARCVDAVVVRGPDVLTPANLRRRLRTAVARVDPDAAARRARTAHDQRHVRRHGQVDGLACLEVWSDPRDVLALWKAATALAGPDDAADPRSLGARRVDAIVGALLGAADQTPAGRAGPAVEVQVVVDLATLLGLADNPAELRGVGTIPAGLARDWMSEATTWRRLVTDPVSGHLLDYGTKVRLAPERLQRFLVSRDQRCCFPGCRVPADRCEADHDPPWRADGSGGRTSAAGMSMLCRQHHLWVTHGGWSRQRLPDGTTQFTSPSGRTYLGPRPPTLPNVSDQDDPSG